MSQSQTFGATSTAEEVTEGIDLRGTTWVVTGCDSGLGYETARVLALRGGRIVGLARTAQKAEEALERLGIDGVSVACELSDLASVRRAVQSVRGVGPLAGIIANAGIMALPELRQISGYEAQFFTNHIGHFVLVTGLMDQLTATGRVVILSSAAQRFAKGGLELDNLAGEVDYDAWRMYGRSKLANVLFARSLATRFAGTGRTANSVHPGVIETNLGRHVVNADAMYANLRPVMKTVEAGAATQVYVATHPDLSAVSGLYFSDCAPHDPIEPGTDDALAETLWVRSEAIAASLP